MRTIVGRQTCDVLLQSRCTLPIDIYGAAIMFLPAACQRIHMASRSRANQCFRFETTFSHDRGKQETSPFPPKQKRGLDQVQIDHRNTPYDHSRYVWSLADTPQLWLTRYNMTATLPRANQLMRKNSNYAPYGKACITRFHPRCGLSGTRRGRAEHISNQQFVGARGFWVRGHVSATTVGAL